MNNDFIKYPQGNIPKNTFCNCCKRYNARNVTCDIIIIKNNQVLLIKRANEPLKNYWCFPGGYLNWDETIEECAIRETKEETGYECDVEFFKVSSNPNRDDKRQNVAIFLTAKIIKKVSKHDDEVSEIKWFDFNKLPKNMAFDHPEIFKLYLESIKN